MKENLLVSSCLLGELVKYNGSHNKIDTNLLKELKNKYNIIPVCPEVQGGLDTPRIPCEIISYNPIKVINKNQEDKTKEFLKGANIALELCKEFNISKALLKANSPSCSNEKVYDGTFSSKLIIQKGITSNLLEKHHIKIYNENQIENLLK